MIRFTDDHAPRLRRIAPLSVFPAVSEELEAGARLIADDAKASIIDGSISGPGHIASLPGEAPNADTHDLDEHIRVGDLIETAATIQTSVISDSDHAWIERGGSKMEPRPYLEPATERARPDVRSSLVERFRKIVAG